MQMPVAEVKAKLSEVIKLVQTGASVEITSHSHPVARLIPASMANVYTGRLLKLTEMMDGASVSRMAEAMGLEKAGDLGQYLDGTVEPTFAFMETLAHRFHVDAEWLKHGSHPGYPWVEHSCSYYNAVDVIEDLERLAPKEIFFARVSHQGRNPEEDRGEAGLIIKWDSLTYQVFGQVLHVSGHVGGTGTGQLWTLCALTKELPNKHPWSVSGKVVSADLFHDIFDGKAWPGLIEKCAYSTWWDDLSDYTHSFPTVAGPNGEGYARHYGKSFLDAQEVLRSHVKLQELERLIRESKVAESPQQQ